jgi:hypothetical protein
MPSRRRFLGAGLGAIGASAMIQAWPVKAAKQGELSLKVDVNDPAALTAAIAARAREVLGSNRIERGEIFFHMPSATGYPKWYAWDSGWNIIALSRLEPEMAYRELATEFKMQLADGMVPHEALIPGVSHYEDSQFYRDYYDDEGRCHILDPPSFLIAAERLYERTRDPRVLGLLPAMHRCLDYLAGPRMLRGEGMIAIIQSWEAGTDMAPVFDEIMGVNPRNPLAWFKADPELRAVIHHDAQLGWDLGRIAAADRFVFDDLCVNAIAAAGALAVSCLDEANHDPAHAAKYRGLAEALTAAMERHCWDEERGSFFPRFGIKQPRTAYRVCLTGLLPLLSGLVDKRKAERVINDYLLSADHFAGPWPVPFNSNREMAREHNPLLHSMLWRGPCIWINLNWMVARAAAVYGRDDIARDITRRTARLIAQNDFREFYHPRTGAGLGATGFTWPALAVDLIAEYGLE